MIYDLKKLHVHVTVCMQILGFDDVPPRIWVFMSLWVYLWDGDGGKSEVGEAIDEALLAGLNSAFRHHSDGTEVQMRRRTFRREVSPDEKEIRAGRRRRGARETGEVLYR